jgi:hypothetical protein
MPIRTGLANHVEMVHRPGEAALALKLFTLLGCAPKSLPAAFAGVVFHSSDDLSLWVSEVTPEQWAFEQWLQAQLKHGGTAESAAYAEQLRLRPQKFAHFGIGLSTLGEWEVLVDRVRAAVETDPDLKGRVSLPLVKRPEDEGSIARETGGKLATTLYQAFLRTDIVAAGLLTLGQGIELQHYLENDPAYRAAAE